MGSFSRSEVQKKREMKMKKLTTLNTDESEKEKARLMDASIDAMQSAGVSFGRSRCARERVGDRIVVGSLRAFRFVSFRRAVDAVCFVSFHSFIHSFIHSCCNTSTRVVLVLVSFRRWVSCRACRACRSCASVVCD